MLLTNSAPRGFQTITDECGLHFWDRALTMSLTGPKYGDAQVKHICQLKSLRKLHLMRTKITGDGLRQIQESLPDCEVMFRP